MLQVRPKSVNSSSANAEIEAIYRRYWTPRCADHDGDELAADEVPSLTRLCRDLDRIRAELDRIATAAADPLAPGAAEILTAGTDLEPWCNNGIVAETLLDLAQIGEAIRNEVRR